MKRRWLKGVISNNSDLPSTRSSLIFLAVCEVVDAYTYSIC